jgi:hypothetical protein
MSNDLLITTIEHNDKSIQIYNSDLWLIEQIRELGFGTLSSVEIQNSRVVLIKKLEKKMKPGDKI